MFWLLIEISPLYAKTVVDSNRKDEIIANVFKMLFIGSVFDEVLAPAASLMGASGMTLRPFVLCSPVPTLPRQGGGN